VGFDLSFFVVLLNMKGRSKWLILIALGLLVVVAAFASAEDAPKKGGRVSFKMDVDDDEDDDVVLQVVDDNEVAAANDENDNDNEPTEPETNTESETPKASKKTFSRRKVHRTFDEDEFEGTAEVKQNTRKPQRVSVDALKKQQQEEIAKKKKEEEEAKPRDWKMEKIMISIISTYLVWFAAGIIINTKKAHRWLKNMRGFLDEQFAEIGDPSRQITDLERESFHQFYLQATGRVNVIGARFFIDMKHRQDMVTSVTGLFFGKRDLVSLDIMLQSQMPIVFAMMKNSEKKKMTEDYKDLASSSVTAVPVSRLNAVKVTVLTDNPPVVDMLVDDHPEHGKLLSVIESNADLFVSLHVTDRSNVYQTQKNVIRVVLRLPTSDADHARLVDLLEAVMAFTDNVATLKMGKGAQNRASAVRQAEKREKERRAMEEKREAAEKAKEEKREKEYKAMTPEQRAKADEKARRRQEKKQKVRIVRM